MSRWELYEPNYVDMDPWWELSVGGRCLGLVTCIGGAWYAFAAGRPLGRFESAEEGRNKVLNLLDKSHIFT